MDVHPTQGDRPEIKVQSVGRAFRLLELVAAADGIGVTTLSTETGLATSTVHNLLVTLTQLGYVTSESGRYRLGTAMALLAARVDPAASISSVLTPAVARLAKVTGHSATATVLVGRHARTLEHRDGAGEIVVRPSAAVWQDPLALATGRLLVALRPRTEWPSFVAADERRSASSITARWLAALEMIAEQRLAVRLSRRPDEGGGPIVTAVAAFVAVGGSFPPVSVGVSIPWQLTKNDLDELVTSLWSEAGALSLSLGIDDYGTRPSSDVVEQAAALAADLVPTTQ